MLMNTSTQGAKASLRTSRIELGVVLGLLLAGCQTAKAPAFNTKGPLIQSKTACADFTQTIYFEANEATVGRPADRLLSLAAARTKGCTVTGVAILGLADAKGDAATNLALSHQRAEAVKAALHNHGFDKVDIQTAAAGDVGAQTAAGQDKPLRRQADITFHLSAPPVG